MAENSLYRHLDFDAHNGEGKSAPKGNEKTPETSDTGLWEEFQAGSETAYATIYENNAVRLYRYGLKLVRDENLVKDAIQDLFVELWDSKERLGAVKSIKSYLYTAIRRKLITEASNQRKILQSRLPHGADTIEGENKVSFEINLIEKQRFNDDREKLKEALNRLNGKQREIIHLKYNARLSYKEISNIMSMDMKGTYNLMAYTIKLLRQYLGLIF